MVEPDISKEMIDSGAELVRKLDAHGLEPDAAFWIYLPDLHTWRLFILQAKVEKLGPKEIYSQVQKILKQYRKEIAISLESIALMKTDAPLLKLLRIAIKTGPGIVGIRFQKNVINGTLIEDAYIYRMK